MVLYKSSLAIPFLDYINFKLEHCLKDRSHMEIFAILLSVLFERHHNLEIFVNILLVKNYNEIKNEGAYFRSDIKWWYTFWGRKLNELNKDTTSIKSKEKRNGKPDLILEDLSDCIIEVLNFGDTDFFSNRCKLLIWEATSPIGSTEAKRAASGIGRLKTFYISTVGDKRASDLNLLHL